jgi:demethylmenaquinone methyltransferase / 2-methoxy-6-polyprenyl-1,4-benzoquinol methylase
MAAMEASSSCENTPHPGPLPQGERESVAPHPGPLPQGERESCLHPSSLIPHPSAVSRSPERVRAMFGELARRYDLLNRLLSLGIDRGWRRRTVRLVPPMEGGGPILDVCTGTADLALAYAGLESMRAGQVVGADFCRPMLQIAQAKCRRAGRALAIVEADALRLPFADNAFQIVSVAFGLRNTTDTELALREMARVCRPAGRVAVLEFSMPTAQPWRSIYAWYFHRLLPRIGQALAKNQQAAYNYLPASVERFPQGEALLRMMEAAGLAETRCHRFGFGIATLYVGHKQAVDPRHPLTPGTIEDGPSPARGEGRNDLWP